MNPISSPLRNLTKMLGTSAIVAATLLSHSLRGKSRRIHGRHRAMASSLAILYTELDAMIAHTFGEDRDDWDEEDRDDWDEEDQDDWDEEDRDDWDEEDRDDWDEEDRDDWDDEDEAGEEERLREYMAELEDACGNGDQDACDELEEILGVGRRQGKRMG